MKVGRIMNSHDDVVRLHRPLSLPPVQTARDFLREMLNVSTLVKTWPLIIINSRTPHEAIFFNANFRICATNCGATFAELHAASRCVIHKAGA